MQQVLDRFRREQQFDHPRPVVLADKAISVFVINHANIEQALAKNPILVTALNRVIDYELGAQITKNRLC